MVLEIEERNREIMYISRLKLQNIRGFGTDFEVNFLDDEGQPQLRNVIIGKNGTCKTTLLRCLALGVCWQEEANALLAEPIGPMLTEGTKTGSITVELMEPFQANKPIQIKTNLRQDTKRGEYVYEISGRERLDTQLLVCGIGAGRSGEGADEFRTYQIVDSVYALFNYQQSGLCSVELTLRRLQDYGQKQRKRTFYNSVMRGIKSALGLPAGAEIELPPGGGVTISAPGVGTNIPLQAWADGYRLTMNWILDIFAWAMRARAFNENGNVQGVVLIDEIEQHIHPSLHIELLDRLSKLLPATQLFVTTHSPLTALAARPDEVISLKRKQKGNLGIVAQEPDFDFTGYSAADMLEDERLFNSSARRPEVEREIRRYRQLARKSSNRRTPAESKELSRLATTFTSSEKPGVNKSPLLKELEDIAKKYDL